MAFSRKHINDGEVIVVDLHPHWVFLAPSVSSLLAVVIVGLWIIFGTHGTVKTYGGVAIGLVILFVLGWFGVRYAKWVTTEFAVTNQRVMSMSGIFSKSGIQIPLERINTVEYSRSLIERMVGAGDLVIESASNDGRQTFSDIRHPDEVQLEINRQIQAIGDRGRAVYGAPSGSVPQAAPAPVASVADQLTKLDELRRNGVLSEAEFQAQKARLLQG